MLKDNIKKIREDNHISQRELARRIEMSSQMISKIERGETSPSLETLNKIAVALGVALNKLIENKISSVEDLFNKFNIPDKSFSELSELSNLNIEILNKIFSPYRKGYTDEDIKKLCNSLNLTDEQIQEWLIFDGQKPYEDKNITIMSYWHNCYKNYPYKNVDGINILELKHVDVKEILKALDFTLRLKVKEISERSPSNTIKDFDI